MDRNYKSLPKRKVDDIKLSYTEFETLNYLNYNWNFLESEYIKPLFFEEEIGAIYFPFIEGRDLFNRNFLLKNFTNNIDSQTNNVFKSIGISLFKYHKNTVREDILDIDNYFEKIFNLIDTVKSLTKIKNLETIEKHTDLIKTNYSNKLQFANCIKGFEIRNVRITDSNKIILFDPGKIKYEPLLTDLARFIVSCRILYWGSPLFIKSFKISPLETNFLYGYKTNYSSQEKMYLHIITLKTILKEWIAKYYSTVQKDIGKSSKIFLIRHYLNKGFLKIYNNEIQELKKYL